jgi:hypothetical protein
LVGLDEIPMAFSQTRIKLYKNIWKREKEIEWEEANKSRVMQLAQREENSKFFQNYAKGRIRILSRKCQN